MCDLGAAHGLLLIHSYQGRRHDFGTGGAELEVGRKMCARLCACKFLTHPPVRKQAHLSHITAIIECRCYLGLPQLWYVITDIDNYDVD